MPGDRPSTASVPGSTSARSRSSADPATASAYRTGKVAVATPEVPSVQVTRAVAVPGLVRADTFHVHTTRPSAPAVGVVVNPAAVDTDPDGQITCAEQTAPGVVVTAIVAVDPRGAGSGRATNATGSDPVRGALPGRGVAAVSGRGVAGAPAARGMP